MLRQKGGFNMQFETARDIGAKTPKVHRRCARRHSPALQAITGARLLAAGMARTIAEAAACTGSNLTYVHAAVILLKAENEILVNQVLAGEISLPHAAQRVRHIAALIDAHRRASEADIIQAVKIIGRPMLVAAE
jgi:hypothetical protein